MVENKVGCFINVFFYFFVEIVYVFDVNGSFFEVGCNFGFGWFVMIFVIKSIYGNVFCI